MRTSNALTRLRVIYNVYKQSGNAQVMTCECCGSTNIRKVKGRYDLQSKKYTGIYECMECGATCQEVQKWRSV